MQVSHWGLEKRVGKKCRPFIFVSSFEHFKGIGTDVKTHNLHMDHEQAVNGAIERYGGGAPKDKDPAKAETGHFIRSFRLMILVEPQCLNPRIPTG